MKVISMSGKIEETQYTSNTYKWLKDYWFAIVAIVSVVASFVTMQGDTRALESRVSAMEIKQEQITRDISTIKETTSSINARLEFVVDYIKTN